MLTMTYYDILWLILTWYSQRILKPYMVSHDQPVACFLEQNPHPARGDMASYLTSWKSVGSLRKMPSWVLQNGNSSRGILQSMPWMPWIQEIGGWWRWIGGGNWDLANPNGMRFASLLVFARVPGSLPNTAFGSLPNTAISGHFQTPFKGTLDHCMVWFHCRVAYHSYELLASKDRGMNWKVGFVNSSWLKTNTSCQPCPAGKSK